MVRRLPPRRLRPHPYIVVNIARSRAAARAPLWPCSRSRLISGSIWPKKSFTSALVSGRLPLGWPMYSCACRTAFRSRRAKPVNIPKVLRHTWGHS